MRNIPTQRVTRNYRASSAPRHAAAFTLVEILIVVVILGIMAMIVIPQFSNASYQARENTLKDDMRFLRLQVQVFSAQHRDVPPGYPAGNTGAVPTASDFEAQMVQHTSEDCATNATATAVYKFGPYLSRLPINPINGESAVHVIANGTAMPAAASLPIMNGGTPYGWIYKPQTQQFMANLAGNDSNGTPFANY